jgi:anti-sigma factor RsiW
MRRIFAATDKNPEWHPGEADLLLYVDGELSTRKAALLRAHLNACWACRVKAEKVEATISAFMDYRHRVAANLPALPTEAAFHHRLHELAKQPRAKHPFWTAVLAMPRIFLTQSFRARLVYGAVIVSALIIAIGLKFIWPSRVSAGELLANSSAAEEVKANDVSLVLHRSLLLEKRRSDDRKVLDRRHIDLWRGGKNGVTARRVYDDSGRLVAGEWSQRDGSAEIYQRGLQPRSEEHAETVLALLKTPEELWRFDLSARTFQDLIKDTAQARVKRQGAYYIVSFAPDHDTGSLLEAVLTVRRDDLRAVGVDLLIASPRDSHSPATSARPASQIYSIVEESFEEQPAARADSHVFAPDPELVAAELTESPRATADLQIETTYLLDQIGATLGQQITVVIGADHKLHVEGVVETEGRKAEILSALAPIRSNPAVNVRVMSYAEVLRRARPGSPRTNAAPGALPEENTTVPAEAELSAYLASQAAPGQEIDLREQVRQFSEQVVGDSSEALRHAWVLKWLAGVLPPAEIYGLSEAARRQYSFMMAEHAQQVGEHTRKLRLRLEPVFFAVETSPGRPDAAENPATAVQAIDRLFDAVMRADKTIQSTFSITFGSGASTPIKSPEFHNSLLEAERLACWIQSTTGGSGCNTSVVDGKVKP